MKIIICGAGQVGYSIAKYLSESGTEVVVIDTSIDLLNQIESELDVQVFQGFASSPRVLQRAGARDADMLIAVTPVDEINMVACQVAHSLFHMPARIARIRNQDYLQGEWSGLFSETHIPIDHTISPELEVAKYINEQIANPGASSTLSLAGGLVSIIEVTCDETCPVINTPLRQLNSLFPDLSIEIVSILRDDEVVTPTGSEQIFTGDKVYFVSDQNYINRAMAAFGRKQPKICNIVILSSGAIGFELAKILEAKSGDVRVHLIDSDRKNAEYAARHLRRTIVLHGDALDDTILKEAQIQDADCFVAVSDSDQTNLIASQRVKDFGLDTVLTILNRPALTPLAEKLEVDAVIDPHAITVSCVLKHVRRGLIREVHSLADIRSEIIETVIPSHSPLIDEVACDTQHLPEGVRIGAIVRGNDVLVPHLKPRIRAEDRLILVTSNTNIHNTEKFFRMRADFF